MLERAISNQTFGDYLWACGGRQQTNLISGTMLQMRGTSITHWSLERPGLVMPVRPDPTGENGPTRMQVRGRMWRKTSRGLYVPEDVDGSVPEQRIVEAAAVLPTYGGVTGWAGLRWFGGYWFDGLASGGLEMLPVTLAIGDSKIRSQPGIHVSEETIAPADLTVKDGMPVTIPIYSVTFSMRHAASDREAAKHLSMAAYSDLVSINEAATYAGMRPREGLSSWFGIPQCRTGIELADENCWSPPEVDLLHIWMLDADLGRPMMNRPVFDRFGNLIGTPDLLDVEAGVVGQYNGALHLEGVQRRQDREREEAYRSVGLECFTMLAGDSGDPYRMAERMHAARARARWAAPSTREWTIEPPRWWIPTNSVEQRRNLDEGQRARLLKLRLRAG